jgi:ABC-type phosphate/phosphonate transport system substrate-binding protein
VTEEDLKEFLEANKAEVQAQVKERLINGLLSSHQWTMRDQIGEVVAEFMKTEIMPEVRAYLVSEKSAILEGAIKAASGIGDMLAQQLITQAAKNINEKSSYQFRKVAEAIFGS